MQLVIALIGPCSQLMDDLKVIFDPFEVAVDVGGFRIMGGKRHMGRTQVLPFLKVSGPTLG